MFQLRSSGMVQSTLTCWAILPFPKWDISESYKRMASIAMHFMHNICNLYIKIDVHQSHVREIETYGPCAHENNRANK